MTEENKNEEGQEEDKVAEETQTVTVVEAIEDLVTACLQLKEAIEVEKAGEADEGEDKESEGEEGKQDGE